MKIIILTRGVPSKENPQEGCFEWDQACALKSIGHEPIVMSLDARLRKKRHKWGITHEFKDGIETYKIYFGTTTIIEHLVSFKLSQMFNNYLIIKLFKHVIKQHPDATILHAHYLYLIYSAAKIKDKFNFPVIGTEHLSLLALDSLNKRVKTIGNQSYIKLNQLITVSNYLRDKIKLHFNVDSKVCGNVLGKEFIETLYSKKEEGDYFTFVACGSLLDIKDYKTLVEAFSFIKDKYCRLYIIGDGPQRKSLNKLIHDFGLDDRVKLLGRKNKYEIINIFDKSDCFVVSSKSETFGVVVIEALSRGLPIVTTKCGGVNGIINQKNGVFVDVGDSKGMASAMQYIKNNIDQYNHSSIRTECLENYSPIIIAKKLESIYTNVINNTRQAE